MSTASSNHPINLLYDDIIVVLDDGNEILMKRCKKCDYVTGNQFSLKHVHSRWCASTWFFKYMHKNTKGSGVRAKCVHCHIVLNRPNDKEMNQHYQIYTQRNLKLNNHQCTQKWADMESVSFDSVSAMEIKTQKKRQEFMPGYRSTYISMPNGLQRYGECQVCKCLIEPPSLEKHRDQCELPNEAQVVLTSPTDFASPTDISSTENAEDYAIRRPSDPNHRCCFICDTKLNGAFVNIYETMTSHSSTSVHKYVNQFLEGKPSIRHGTFEETNANRNLLCSGCFNKINDLDLARVTAKRLHHELKWELSQTEASYTSQKHAKNRKIEPELIIEMTLDS